MKPLLLFLSLWIALPSSPAQSSAKPNVLFIAVDDLNDWIGCLGGHPQTQTPNFDRLARSSLLFTNAHCPGAACNPSRTAIMTGLSPHTSGLYENGQKMREVLPEAELLPKFFSRHGYWSGGSGKMLHYFIDARSWDTYFPAKETENPFPRTLYPEKRPVSLPRGGPWQYVETDWGPLDATDEEFGGDWLVTKWVGEQLQRDHTQPFFLACGIYRPHEPWFVPKAYFDLFPLEDIQLPPGYKEDDLEDLPPAGKRRGPNRYFAHIQEHGQWKQAIQGYLASIAFADAMLGRVLDALEQSPHRDNTIVVLWSPHGWHLGDKQHWQKFTAWRACSRVPLMIQVPEGAPGLPQGTQPGRSDAPVNLLSLYPTLLDLCGLPPKADNDGPSLVPLLQNPEADWPHVSLTHLGEPGSFGLSARDWRYIHYANGDEELYHIAEDPYEWTNLATHPEHRSKLKELRALAPTEFAPLVQPSVASLPRLTWLPAAEHPQAPPSLPDGSPFDVVFRNETSQPVELFWISPQGKTRSYGQIGKGKRKRQHTRPCAAWMIADANQQALGYFVVGDRKAQAIIPKTAEPQTEATSQKPNVLFIAVDDLRPELGCYGVEAIQTPHIDALAASGIVFNRAYCQMAVCNPSRVSLLTGLRPDSTRVWDLVTRFRETIPDVITLPQHFRKHGYYALSYGKIFHNPWPDNASWDEPHAWPDASLWSEQAKQRLRDYRQEMRQAGKSAAARARMRAQALERVDVPDHEHIDGAITEQALAALDRLAAKPQPFFLAVGYVRPHLPFVVPNKYWDLYDPATIPLAEHALLPKNTPRFAMNTMYELRDYLDFAETPDPQTGSLTRDQQRELKHGYYASVSFIDAQVGRLLAALRELGLEEDTLVVLWGDHGWKLGEHNSWCKQTNYEVDTRSPLIFRVPGLSSAGQTAQGLVEFVDVYPTLCDLAGLPLAEHLEGQSVTTLLEDPSMPGKGAAFSQFGRRIGNERKLMGYAMRTEQHRYVEWIDRKTRETIAEELYDHAVDPQETTNLANDPQTKNQLVELRNQMWRMLPPPPELPSAPQARPVLRLENAGPAPLKIFWIAPDGTQHPKGTIQPGKGITQNTAIGHQFLVVTDGGKELQTITVRRPNETVHLSASPRPNIVVIMGDDWSWPHAGILGDATAQTPAFDRIAQEGEHFANA